MSFTSYLSIEGCLVGETTDGSFGKDYQIDALGSVVGIIVDGTSIDSSYRYSGFGELVFSDGNVTQLYFSWIGAWGYREASSLRYIRSRHLCTQTAVWNSRDTMWPNERPYCYVNDRPTTLYDPFGEQGQGFPGIPPLPTVRDILPIPEIKSQPFIGPPYTQPPATGCDCTGKAKAIHVRGPRLPAHGKKNMTRQECCDAVCETYCKTIDRLDTAEENMCTGILHCISTNLMLDPCPKGTAYHDECFSLGLCKDDPNVYGDGCGASDEPPSAAGGFMCCQECRMRACCFVSKFRDEADRTRDLGFLRCYGTKKR